MNTARLDDALYVDLGRLTNDLDNIVLGVWDRPRGHGDC